MQQGHMLDYYTYQHHNSKGHRLYLYFLESM